MPTIADIPATAYDANRLLGTDDYYQIDGATHLARSMSRWTVGRTIILYFRAAKLAEYGEDGTIIVYPAPNDHAVARRVSRLLPVDWGVRVVPGRSRLRLVYRLQYVLLLGDHVRFPPDGGVWYHGSFTSQQALDYEVQDRLGIYDDEPEPTCDICGRAQGDSPGQFAPSVYARPYPEDWNGETGCHVYCEVFDAVDLGD
jgi:hypothetical protein